MTKKRNISAKYSVIVRKLAEEHGETGTGFHIGENATLARCIGYTMQYIVGGSHVHYRYSRYERALSSAIQMHPIREGTLVHVDIACGPGLFSWVVVDYLRSNPLIDISTYGYDRAPNMARLARLIWDGLNEDEIFFCHYKIERLLDLIRKSRDMNPSILITFGHILVQTCGDYEALKYFSRIIAYLARIGECRILAVDATTGDRPERFRVACDRLRTAIEKKGLIVDNPHIVESEMWTMARARQRA